MKLSDCKQYDVVRISEIRRLADFKIDSICRREPKVGDVATIVEVYTSPTLGFELECSDDEGVPYWLHAFKADDLVVEKLRQSFVESSNKQKMKGKKQREHWSFITCFWVAVVIVAISAVTVTLLMHKPVWIEMEILAGVVGAIMTIFYSYVLYRGVFFSKDETISIRRSWIDASSFVPDGSVGAAFFGEITASGASEGPLGLVIGFLLDILVCLVLSFVLAFLLWVGVSIAVIGIVTISIPIFYIFKRSVLFVMRHVEECHGKLWRSFLYGISYAAAKTAILCLIVFASHELAHLIKFHILNG